MSCFLQNLFCDTKSKVRMPPSPHDIKFHRIFVLRAPPLCLLRAFEALWKIVDEINLQNLPLNNK